MQTTLRLIKLFYKSRLGLFFKISNEQDFQRYRISQIVGCKTTVIMNSNFKDVSENLFKRVD